MSFKKKKNIAFIVVIVAVCIILVILYIGIQYKKNKDWKPGEVVIQFKVGINETEARSIIQSYNLTIVEISDNNSDNIDALVKVPKGEEREYAKMLKENSSIDDAYMPPAPPR